jgi:hypothetical protein
MKHAVPAMLLFTLLAAGSAAHAERPETIPAQLDTPFTLAVGETASVAPDGFEVTLRTLSEESGCLDIKDCAVMLFRGTLTMLLDPRRQLANVDQRLARGFPATVDFAGYRVELTDVRRAAAGAPLLVILRVVRN